MLAQTKLHRELPVIRRDEEGSDITAFGESQTFSAKF